MEVSGFNSGEYEKRAERHVRSCSFGSLRLDGQKLDKACRESRLTTQVAYSELA